MQDYSDELAGFYGRLRAVAVARTGNREDAEDLVQTTMHKALSNPPGLKGTALLAWLCAVLRNEHIDEQRNGWQRFRDGEISDDEVEAITGRPADADLALELRQTLQIIARLGKKCRELLLLTGAGYKTREIAEMLSTPMGTIGREMMDCRRRLYEQTGRPARDHA